MPMTDRPIRNVLVIDGQGGQLGSQLIRALRARLPEVNITAVGTNSAATAAMLKAGADRAATGENPVLVACRRADAILGPIGIVVADALCGEVTPAMACAVGQAEGTRILLPMQKCETLVAGVAPETTTALVEDAAEKLAALARKNGLA